MFLIFFPTLANRDCVGKSLRLMVLFLVIFSAKIVFAENNIEILSVSSNETEKKLEITIKSTGKAISTIYELPNPDRIIVDIAEANFSKTFTNQVNSNIAKVETKSISDVKPAIARIEILLSEKNAYEAKKEDNVIVLNLSKSEKVGSPSGQNKSSAKEEDISKLSANITADSSQSTKAYDVGGKDKIGGVIGGSKSVGKQLPEINPLDNKISPKSKEQQMQDAFNFSGYNKERITVEFQKMDLHNVFSFLRQVSGVNIVVDETVQGSLTLVLDDVPWDFALDIILNLKDLEKEERFNTLVIYPKKKEFKWPEKGQNNLSFQADSKVVQQEALVIRQQEKQPVEVAEAKQEIALAKEAEKRENFEAAVGFYEKALEKWPNNSKLAYRISSIYLIQLRQNAKSLYYSKIALEKDPNNFSAALNAAIASANMQDKQKAVIYFNQCTQVKKPSKESLISYAAFSEEQHEYAGALKILDKHNSLYGEDLDVMVAEARIYDKMGQRQQATEKYKKIMLSGYSVPADLDKYIKGRVALN